MTNFVEINRPISRMLKKGSKIKLHGEPNTALHKIKKAIKDAPILRAPNYDKPMNIFSFSSFHIVDAVLL